jgi:hypothetical protein
MLIIPMADQRFGTVNQAALKADQDWAKQSLHVD